MVPDMTIFIGISLVKSGRPTPKLKFLPSDLEVHSFELSRLALL